MAQRDTSQGSALGRVLFQWSSVKPPLSFFRQVLTGLGNRRRVRTLLPSLEMHSEALAALSGEIEARFLACGRAMQGQVGLTGKLVQQSRGLAARDASARSGHAPAQHLQALTNRQLDLAVEFAAEVGRLAGLLDAHAGRLRQLRDEQQQIERSFAPIRALRAFFRIEAASLPENIQALFVGVAEEMRKLETAVSENFSTQDESFAQTTRAVLATAVNLREQAEHHGHAATSKREGLAAAHQHHEAQTAEAAERNVRLGQAIGEIERATDQITVSLQYQDITRQKLEHVQTAAGDLIEGFAAKVTPAAQEMRQHEVLCRIQATQLEAVQGELDQAASGISTNLRAVLDRLRDIEHDCLSLSRLQQVTAGMDAVIGEVVDAHRVAADLMRGSLENLTEAIRAVRGFATATSGATDAMRQLATDIHLMGLNAQVQAVHAKSGSLEVLSGAASQISEEARVRGCRFEEQLVAMTDELTRLVDRSETFRRSMQERYDTLRIESETTLQTLTAEHGQAKATVEEVGTLLHQLGSQAGELFDSVDLADFSRDALANAQEVFLQLAELCAVAAAGAPAEDPASANAMHQRYTMESERIAHAQALAKASGVAAVAAPVVAAAASPEVELFFDETPAPASAPVAAAAAGNNDGLPDNVELF